MKKKDNSVFYVDPMGYKNLSIYDISLLGNINMNINYFTSDKFEFDDFHMPTHKIYSYSSKKGIKKILSYFLNQLTLWKHIKNKKPQLVHFQWLKLPVIDLLLLKFLKNKKIKIVFTAHNLLPHDSGKSQEKNYQKIYDIVDIIIVHSDITKKELIEKFKISSDKIKTIPHGLLDIKSYNKIKVQDIKQSISEKFNLEKKTLFTFLGGINYYKGIDVVINAWNQVKDNDVHLLVAGKGGEKYLMNLEKKENVTLINRFLENEEFEAYLELSDYVLLPYRQISQSGVLLSALSKRRKVIVTNKGGLTDPFEVGEIGITLEKLTSKNVFDAIQLGKQNKLNKVNESIWKKIEKKYDWKKIGNQTQELYLSQMKK